MVDLEFIYLQENITIQANLSDDFATIFNKFYQKLDIEPNTVIFLFNNKQIPTNKKLIDITNGSPKKDKKIKITVLPLSINNRKKLIENSKDIICPKCFEQCRIKIEDYLIELFDCKNNHSTKIKLDEFEKSQQINLENIKCNICSNKNIGNIFNQKNFFYCLNCEKNICCLCKERHDNKHFTSIIKYEQKNYFCSKHNNPYIKYCKECKINICNLCENEHSKHKLDNYKNIISNIDNKKIELEKIKIEIDIFNNNVKKIINGLNQLIENMEIYYKIFNNIYNNFDEKNKNYNVLNNMKLIDINNNICKELLEINKNNNYNEKIDKILKIYYKIKGNNDNDPFNFSWVDTNENNNFNKTNVIQLFSDIPSYIKKESKISKDSIYRCNYCPYTPLMKIMYKGYKIYMEYRCQNGHYSYEKLYDFYQRNKINSINTNICSVCYETYNGIQNFYYCNDCKKYFCEIDKDSHENFDNLPHNLINLKYIGNVCNEHLNIINDYCLDCHKNICHKCKSHFNHKKASLSKMIIDDNKLEEYRNKISELKGDYNNFYDECDKTIREVINYIENFNKNLKNFKKVNDYSFNICEDLLNSYQYLKNENALNYETIENLNSILNFNEIKFNMDKNFNCIARLIYINSIITLEYNTLFKLKENFRNFDLQITDEEEKLIKDKNVDNDGLEYRTVVDENFQNTFYGYFKYNPDGNETIYEINGFGIKMNKHYKYVGEFKNGKCNGYGVYYFESGAFKFAKNDLDTTEAFKLYALSGQIEFCLYNKIVDKYQKYGLYLIDMPNGTKKINMIKNNNFDDYGIMYNINGEFYEGYHLSGVRHGYGIMNSHAENKIKKGLFYKGELQFGSLKHKDWLSQGEFDMGLKNGYIIEYDQLGRKQFEGEYQNGKREGFGINYYDNGNISYKGYFINNLEDKFGFMYNSSGKVFYAGNIDKGQKRGFGIYYAYGQSGNRLYKYIGNWVDDDKCDGYLLKKYPDGDYFFGDTKMFVYQTFMQYKLGNKIYIGDTQLSSTKREGYGETTYSDGNVEKGIYINDNLILNTTNNDN